MQDKVVIITGASTGIGAALAVEIARRGGKVVLAARRERELAEVAAGIGAAALAVPMDVTVREDHDHLRDAAIAKFGRVDAYVANAGRGISRMPSQLTDDDINNMILINVKSVLYGVHAMLPHFRDRKAGHFVAVSSMLGRVPFTPIRSAYSAAKAALNSLMGSVRLELRAELPGVHVTTVLPGVVATEFGTRALHGGADSRAMPGAQPVAEVATIIADAIASPSPRAEVYTRPPMKDAMLGYYADVDAAESKPPFSGPR